jgi:hypothetical protein
MPLLVAVRDLLFRSKIDEAARRSGVAVRHAPRDAPLVDAVRALEAPTVLADLDAPGALDALAAARTAGAARVIGYLGHLQHDLAEAAAAAGVEVLTRGQLVGRLDAILREAAGTAPAAPR